MLIKDFLGGGVVSEAYISYRLFSHTTVLLEDVKKRFIWVLLDIFGFSFNLLLNIET